MPSLIDKLFTAHLRKGWRGNISLWKLLQRLFGKQRVIVKTAYNTLLSCDPHDHVASYVLRYGFYESEVLEALLPYAQDAIVWDIGAYHGAVGLCLEKAGALQTVLFEPDLHNAMSAWANLKLNQSKATLIPAGLSDQALSVAHFYHQPDNSGMSGFKQWFEYVNYEPRIAFLMRGDELVNQGMLQAPTLIKIDVEGFELQVLKGLSQCILRQEFQALVFEAHSDLLEQPSAEIKTWLVEHDFEISKLKRNEPTAHALDNFLATPIRSKK